MHEVQIERQVLGAFIKDDSTHDYLDRVQEDDFISRFHQEVFKAIKLMHIKKTSIDMVTVAEKLIGKYSLSDLIDLTNTVVTTATIEGDIKALKNVSNRRKLSNKAALIAEMAKDHSLEFEEIQNNALKEIEELEVVASVDVISLKEATLESIDLITDRYKQRDDKSY